MNEAVRLKDKMAGLTNKWKGKDPMKGSDDYMKMRLDRMVFRLLKRKLDKIEFKTTPQIKTAKEVFKF